MGAAFDTRSLQRWRSSARSVEGPWLAVAGILGSAGLAVVLGIHDLTREAFWHDEAFSVDAAGRRWTDLASQAFGTEMNMAAYYAVLKVWLLAASDDGWVRGLSVAFAAASVVVGGALAWRLFGSGVGAMAAASLASNAFLLQYAQEARAYTMLVFMACLSAWLLTTARLDGGRWRWTAYALAAAALPYTHLVGVFVLAAQVIAILAIAPRPPGRTLAAVGALATVVMLPALVAFATQATRAVSWITPPTAGAAIAAWGRVAGAGDPGSLGPLASWLPQVMAVLAIIGAIKGWRRGGADRWGVLLLGAWLIVPFVGLLVVSTVKPLFVVRYLIPVVAPLAMLAALGVASIPWRWPRAAVAVLVVGLSLNGAIGWYGSQPRPAWREATALLLEQAGPADRSVIIGDWGRVLTHYARAQGRGDDLPLRLWRDLEPAASDFSAVLGRTAVRLAAEGRTIWVVAAGPDAANPAVDDRFDGLRQTYRAIETTTLPQLVIARFEPLASP